MSNTVTYLCDRGTSTDGNIQEPGDVILERSYKRGQCKSKLRSEVFQLQESVEEIVENQV